MTMATLPIRLRHVPGFGRRKVKLNQRAALDCKSVKTSSILVPASKPFQHVSRFTPWAVEAVATCVATFTFRACSVPRGRIDMKVRVR